MIYIYRIHFQFNNTIVQAIIRQQISYIIFLIISVIKPHFDVIHYKQTFQMRQSIDKGKFEEFAWI